MVTTRDPHTAAATRIRVEPQSDDVPADESMFRFVRLRAHWAFLGALFLGVVLRIGMWIALPNPLMTFTDANVYVRAAQEFLFRPIEGRTAGYPLFLRVVHSINGSVDAPVITQHLLA